MVITSRNNPFIKRILSLREKKYRREYGEYIIGRMGIPYRAKGINIISVAIDAPQDKINSLTGLIGKLDGVSAKAAYSKLN